MLSETRHDRRTSASPDLSPLRRKDAAAAQAVRPEETRSGSPRLWLPAMRRSVVAGLAEPAFLIWIICAMAEEGVMSPGDREWLERWLLTQRERMRAISDLTREQLRRSYDQLKRSYELLKQETPKGWRPPPKDPDAGP